MINYFKFITIFSILVLISGSNLIKIPLTVVYNVNNVAYTTNIQIGTPPQDEEMAIDTISSLIVIQKMICNTGVENCPERFYKSNQSQTYNSLNSTFQFPFNIYSSPPTCNMATDIFNFDRYQFENLSFV